VVILLFKLLHPALAGAYTLTRIRGLICEVECLTKLHSLYTYGWSKYGQLGHGDFEDHLVPHKVEALKDSTISQVIVLETFTNMIL
jgi:alpha-tubulin suppressor-like RCC1 family protein